MNLSIPLPEAHPKLKTYPSCTYFFCSRSLQLPQYFPGHAVCNGNRLGSQQDLQPEGLCKVTPTSHLSCDSRSPSSPSTADFLSLHPPRRQSASGTRRSESGVQRSLPPANRSVRYRGRRHRSLRPRRLAAWPRLWSLRRPDGLFPAPVPAFTAPTSPATCRLWVLSVRTNFATLGT